MLALRKPIGGMYFEVYKVGNFYRCRVLSSNGTNEVWANKRYEKSIPICLARLDNWLTEDDD